MPSTPTTCTNVPASSGPAMAPAVPPAAMAPNSRRPCSLENTSAITPQNTDGSSTLKTLTQTKNARAMTTLGQVCSP